MRDRLLVARPEENRRAVAGTESIELSLGQELRDRRADLAAVVHEVGEPLRAPLLRELLEPRELRPRVRLRGDDEPNARSALEDAELGRARHPGRVLDLHAEAQVG